MCTLASSAAAERAFSSAGNFQSEKRTRLEPATMQAACLLKAWWHDEVLGFDSILSIALDPEDSEQGSELDSGLSAGEHREGSGAGEEEGGGGEEEGGAGEAEGGDDEEDDEEGGDDEDDDEDGGDDEDDDEEGGDDEDDGFVA
jgi:hypothetical protein